MLSFMWHQRILNIIQPIKKVKSINKTIFSSYILSLILVLIVVLIGVIAFGENSNSCNTYPCEI